MRKIKIENKFIGEGEACFVVAEAGANHDSVLQRGKDLIDGAVSAGFDAIKFQHYKASKIVTKTAPKYWVDPNPNETQYQIFDKLDKLTKDEWKELFDYGKKCGIIIFSTPFDEENVDFLEEIGCPAYKVAAADLTHLPLIKHIAEKGKPIFLSVGMATLGEIEDAIKTIKSVGNDDIIILHSITNYPTKPEDANLKIIQKLKTVFSDYPIGFSDHTSGPVVPTAAVALGAKVIEKHFTIDKTLPESPDHRLSVDIEEGRLMVNNIRTTEKALGTDVRMGPIEAEKEAYKYARRSIVAKVAISKGMKITKDMLAIKRPGTGIPPKFFDLVIGKTAERDIAEDEVINWNDI